MGNETSVMVTSPVQTYPLADRHGTGPNSRLAVGVSPACCSFSWARHPWCAVLPHRSYVHQAAAAAHRPFVWTVNTEAYGGRGPALMEQLSAIVQRCLAGTSQVTVYSGRLLWWLGGSPPCMTSACPSGRYFSVRCAALLLHRCGLVVISLPTPVLARLSRWHAPPFCS